MSCTINDGRQPTANTTGPQTGAAAGASLNLEHAGAPYCSIPSQKPEFFRLPQKGGDPFFGLSKAYYYRGEERGYWKLARIRERGRARGITLVPFDKVSAFIRKHIPTTTESQEGAQQTEAVA